MIAPSKHQEPQPRWPTQAPLSARADGATIERGRCDHRKRHRRINPIIISHHPSAQSSSRPKSQQQHHSHLGLMKASAFLVKSDIVLHRNYFVRVWSDQWCFLEWKHLYLSAGAGWKIVDRDGDEGDEEPEGRPPPEPEPWCLINATDSEKGTEALEEKHPEGDPEQLL